jgi:hypothetical protein
VALAFARSSDFPFDKPAGEPCTNLDDRDGCRIHSRLRDSGFKGCTVFDCFGAGQKVSARTFEGRSWRDDAATRSAMFAVFPIVRRLHELLWYLDEAIVLVTAADRDATPWLTAFERVRRLSDGSAAELAGLDVDSEYGAVRDLLIDASDISRRAVPASRARRGRAPRPGSDLTGADLAGADLRGLSLRGSIAIAADLRDARLNRCDLLGVDLRDADLSGADLEGAIYLTQMQVNSARGDARTRLPAGFERPRHWART